MGLQAGKEPFSSAALAAEAGRSGVSAGPASGKAGLLPPAANPGCLRGETHNGDLHI